MMTNSHGFSEEMQRCQEYLRGLEEERRKIQVFERELPLCLDLVTQTIETCKQQLAGKTSEYNVNGGVPECSAQTSSDVPVLEEFIPIKRDSSHSDDDDDDDEEHESKKQKNDTNNVSGTNKDEKNNSDVEKNSQKSDWLRSAQLWNQTPDLPSKEVSLVTTVAVKQVHKDDGGAFHPFKKGGAETVTIVSTSSTTGTAGSVGGSKNKKEYKEKQGERKERRCWSPELHKRFVQALQQLGGPHVATPKQIRDLMKVDGLTNDEVKSHLQKYRLNTRRPSSLHSNNTIQTPHFVVVGGLWMPPDYAAMAAANASGEVTGVANTNGIYAPIAKLPPPPFYQGSRSTKQGDELKPSNSNDRDSHNEGGLPSRSPASSSSTHTPTVSPPPGY